MLQFLTLKNNYPDSDKTMAVWDFSFAYPASAQIDREGGNPFTIDTCNAIAECTPERKPILIVCEFINFEKNCLWDNHSVFTEFSFVSQSLSLIEVKKKTVLSTLI